MDLQTIIAGIIILAALLYIGANIWRKIKGFSSNNAACGSGCGCASASKPRKTFAAQR